MKALSFAVLVAITVILSRVAMASCGGTLSGSVATYTTNQSINLTSLGTTDWAAFGYNVNAASIERKSAGGSQISALSQVGTITLGQSNHSSYPPAWQSSWTDGSPDTTISNEPYVVNSVSPAGHAVGQGMSFTVPADTTLRTLTVYVGIAYNSSPIQGKLTATLSDGSAAPYVDTTLTNNPGTQILIGAYTITYNAASAGQMLTVQWVNNNVPTYAQNVFIQAATLQVPGSGGAMNAFPGAEGFGAVTRGANGTTGGRVIHVKTTSDCTGCNSFRDALTASGPRTVVFDTGGTISLASAIVVSNPYLTIACQTAPGGGIQFTGWAVRFVNTHDIIVRYCKSRSGWQTSGDDYSTDHVGFDVSGSGGVTGESVIPMYNVILDHCDMEYSSRDDMDTWDYVQNLTVQRSIMADGIQSSNVNYGLRGWALSGTADVGLTYNATGISVHHNLFAHENQRNPDVRTVGFVELVNNVMYDYGSFGVQVDNATGYDNSINTSSPNNLNVIGNYFKAGGITYTNRLEVTIDTTQNAGLWVYDNISPHRTSATPTTLASNWQVVGDVSVASSNDPSPCSPYAECQPPTSFQASTPFAMSTYPITTQNHSTSTLTVLNNVLADVGANKNTTSTSRPHINSSIDTLTASLISDATNGTGSAPPSTYPAGYNPFVVYPTLATGTAPTDTDCDGIPDDVETAAGLSTTNGNCSTGLGGDSLKTNPTTGYTYLEDYINGNGGIN